MMKKIRINIIQRCVMLLILCLCFLISSCTTSVNNDENKSNTVVNPVDTNPINENFVTVTPVNTNPINENPVTVTPVTEEKNDDLETNDSLTDETNNGVQQEADILITYADVTHDGVNEKIVVDVSSVEETQEAVLKVIDENGNIIWQESAGISHVGWNSLYLCTINEKDFILRYHPYMNQSWADYKYQLFSIDEQGKEETVNSGAVEFCILSVECDLDIEKMLSFYDEVNNYLDKSILLLSTENGELEYSTESEKITRTEEFSWLFTMNFQYDEQDSIEDKLVKFKEEIGKSQ